MGVYTFSVFYMVTTILSEKKKKSEKKFQKKSEKRKSEKIKKFSFSCILSHFVILFGSLYYV